MRQHPACFLDPVDRATGSALGAETDRIFKQYLLVARCGWGLQAFIRLPARRIAISDQAWSGLTFRSSSMRRSIFVPVAHCS